MSTVRDRVKVRTFCGCCNLLFGMAVSLAIALAIGIVGNAGSKEGWFIAIDEYNVQFDGSSVSIGTLQLDYGWKQYCYKLDTTTQTGVATSTTCADLNQPVTVYALSEGSDDFTQATLQLGSTAVLQWGKAMTGVLFWVNIFTLGAMCGFLLLWCNVKFLLSLPYCRIFGLGSLISGIALAITVSGFYFKVFKRVNHAFDDADMERPVGPIPMYNWFFAALNCLSFLGWGCSFLGSFGAYVDSCINEKYQPQRQPQVVYVVNGAAPAPAAYRVQAGTMA